MKSRILAALLSLTLAATSLLPTAGAKFVQTGSTWKDTVNTVAVETTQKITINGTAIEFQCYALKDEYGNLTNYVQLRDVAYALKDTTCKFNVGWSNGSIDLTTDQDYTSIGSEMTALFHGSQPFSVVTPSLRLNGSLQSLDPAISITDANGGGHTYFPLRTICSLVGANVSWSADKGITVTTPFYNFNNAIETAGDLSIRPRSVYWDNGCLFAQCFVINGRDSTVSNIKIKDLSFYDENGVAIASASFGTLNGASIAPHSYITWNFNFDPSCISSSNHDLSYLVCHSSSSYSY